MATYISLVNFTDQGARNVKDTVKRAQAYQEAAQKAGVNVKQIFWTIGQYDIVLVVETADDETAVASVLSVVSKGNIRSQTLRAFSAEEMTRILAKVQ
ncbi:MAG: GYD domain-containing protein [Acidobacteriota bacterium]